MTNPLRFSISDQRLSYTGMRREQRFTKDLIAGFNHKHGPVFRTFGIELVEGSIVTIDDTSNSKSNLGAFRNRKLRESVILAAALPAAAVALNGRGSLNRVPQDQQKTMADLLKRANDRTAAQVMAEVLQITAETMPTGEDFVIQSASGLVILL